MTEGESAGRLEAHDELGRLFNLIAPIIRWLLQGRTPIGPHAKDVHIATLTGRLVLLSVHAQPMHDANGHVVGSVIAIREVTEQERFEREALSEARRLRAAFAASTDAMLIFDHDERIVQLNPRALELLELKEVPDRSLLSACACLPLTSLHEVSSLAQTEALALASKILRGEVLSGDTASDVLLHTCTWGDVALTITGAPIRGTRGQIVGGVMVLRDVTRGQRCRLEQRAHGTLEDLLPIVAGVMARISSVRHIPRRIDASSDIWIHGNAAWLAELFRGVLPSIRVAIVLVEQDTRTLHLAAATGITDEEMSRWRTAIDGADLSDHIPPTLGARLCAGEIVPLTEQEAEPYDWSFIDGHRQLVAPMLLGQRLLGMVVVDARHPTVSATTTQNIARMGALAGLVALMIDRERLSSAGAAPADDRR